ncbi:MAG TPA: hypothetical protein VIU12_30370 [Chryseolinea sp.]
MIDVSVVCMKEYKIGDKILNGEVMIRRLRRRWVMHDQTISREAFRPRFYGNGQFEDGVSVDLRLRLQHPVGNDYWSNERKMATDQFLSDVVNALPPYELIYNGPSPSHCIITGDMSVLFFDLKSLRLWQMLLYAFIILMYN